jgi:hypothetical protein
MPKKTTLKEIGEMLTHVVKHMATKDDIAEVRKDMATKGQVVALHTQVTSIETQLRGMNYGKLETR